MLCDSLSAIDLRLEPGGLRPDRFGSASERSVPAALPSAFRATRVRLGRAMDCGEQTAFLDAPAWRQAVEDGIASVRPGWLCVLVGADASADIPSPWSEKGGDAPPSLVTDVRRAHTNVRAPGRIVEADRFLGAAFA